MSPYFQRHCSVVPATGILSVNNHETSNPVTNMNTVTDSSPETVSAPAPMSAYMIAYYRDSWRREQQRHGVCIEIIERLGLRLTDRVHFSPCCYITATVYCREDLAVLMELAPKWEKRSDANGIIYAATYNGEPIEIQARESALPGTCKLVEEEYEVPAKEAVPAHKATRMVLKCDQPAPNP